MENWIALGDGKPNEGWVNGPGPEVERMIFAAKDAAGSVPYKVSLRWIFYRLWQAGDLAHIPATKKVSKKENAYFRLKAVMSKAVHHGLLKPDWVADETRTSGGRGGYSSVDVWLEQLKDEECYLDWQKDQDQYLMIAFEAAAMAQQFEHYTADYGCRLWPMRGDPSNPYKYRMAREIDRLSWLHGVPVVVLYFGDLDVKGLTIPEAAFRDVKHWSKMTFLSYRVGLNPGDEIRFGIPEIPGKPDAYQWEALNDDQAGKMITEAIERIMNLEILEDTQKEESEATEKVREVLDELIVDDDEGE